jgi:hypothetical protein
LLVPRRALDARLITFGHGQFPEDACGERYLYALSTIETVGAAMEGFACGQQGGTGTDSSQPSSRHVHRMVATAENEADVQRWVAGTPPLYRLHLGDQAAQPELFAEPSPTALWSDPFAPEVALAAGELMLVTVEQAIEHAGVAAQPRGHEVVLRTNLSQWELDHLQPRELKLFFRCADPRWLEVGGSWLVPLAMGDPRPPPLTTPGDQPTLDTIAASIAAGDAFIVPGLMLPVRPEVRQAATGLRVYPQAAVANLPNPP